jgi:hypothetical protein
MRLILITFSFIGIILSNSIWAATEGPATVYKITMTQIELCTGVPLADEHDTTCTGSVIVGTGEKTFNITSVSAGLEVGSWLSTAGLPIGTTFTHAKPTIKREIVFKGTVDAEAIGDDSLGDANYCYCRSESDSTYNSTAGKYKTLQYGVCEDTEALALANAEENTFYVGTDTSNGTTICANAACDSASNGTTGYSKDPTGEDYKFGLAINDPDTSTDTFNMIFKLENPYTVGLIAPTITLAFGTSLAAFAEEYADGSCFMDFFYPQSTISITE